MTKEAKKYLIAGGILLILVLMTKKARASYQVITSWLIPEFEGFRASPYWDVSRYSWGYGTEAPGPTGTITQAQALEDLQAYVYNDYAKLFPRITRELTPAQWAAYLDFSYNLGYGNALNLVDDINAGDDTQLERHWKEYVYSGGEINNDLVNRRLTEWEIWTGRIIP